MPSARIVPHATESDVALEPILREHASVLQNLFELYVYDFSEQMPLRVRESGRFELSPGEVWWTRDDHFAYFIRLRGELAGFALVRRGSRVTQAPDVMDVAEFFVLRGARRSGVGTRAAQGLFRLFPGAWEVRVRHTNSAALRFWSRAVESWTVQPAAIASLSIDGVDWNVLRLDSAGGVAAPRNVGAGS
jgi:predicted acetyltransferase